jgi:hypothetical protein
MGAIMWYDKVLDRCKRDPVYAAGVVDGLEIAKIVLSDHGNYGGLRVVNDKVIHLNSQGLVGTE